MVFNRGVMVVDDESIVTMHLEDTLTQMGYEVVAIASSGEEAVEKARELNPGLVLMDIVMPGEKDGIAAAEEIRTELDIPVIFITAYADKELVERAKLALPYGYIVKPFQANEVRAAMEIAIYRHRLERGLKKSEGVIGEAVNKVKKTTGDWGLPLDDLQQAHESLQRLSEELRARIASSEKAVREQGLVDDIVPVKRLTARATSEILDSLSTVTLLLDLLMCDPTTPSETVPFLQLLEKKAKLTFNDTKDLLNFYGSRPLERQHLDLNELIEETLSHMQEELDATSISVELNLAEGLPPVLADREQLREVVLKLLTNARDFMPDGGSLTLATKVLQARGEDFVELRLDDTGPGISPGVLDSVFNPFFSTKPERERVGLGLSICKAVVESHGGKIWAESDPDKAGATFVFQLPLEPSTKTSPDQERG
jgi:signal transduction histidine kinase